MTSPGRPLSVRESGNITEFDGPYDGVPAWLVTPLLGWLGSQLPIESHRYDRDLERVLAVCVELHVDTRGVPVSAKHLKSLLLGRAEEQAVFLLDLADWCLRHPYPPHVETSEATRRLDGMLRSGASVYEVREAEGGRYLARRVSDEGASLASEVMRSGTVAGSHIAESWRNVYGRDGDPGQGYREAVKAIEAAARPVVSPKNQTATLGTLIRDLQNGASNFTVRLDGDGQVNRLRAVMELLWKGQVDRHGNPDLRKAISPEQAEDALRLAITLVAWFEGGAVSRKPGS